MKIPLLPDYSFAAPWFLLLLLVIPVLAIVRGNTGPAPAIAFSPLNILTSIAPKVKSRFGRISASLLYLALFAGVLALARPQKVNAYETHTASGIEITLAIDVSFSMSTTDFWIGGTQVDRLTAAKYVIGKFIEGRPSDRTGIVIFSGRPHSIAPLTLDHDWLRETIGGEIHFEHKIDSGTAIGTAIAASAKRLMDREAKSKIVVLLTDGVQTMPGLTPSEAAKLAATLGIKVYTIAVGTEGTHYVPKVGRMMEQTFDLETLREIAKLTGAKSYLAKDTNALANIFSEIDQLEKTEIATRKIVEAKDYFPYLVGAAAVFALIGTCLNSTLFRGIP